MTKIVVSSWPSWPPPRAAKELSMRTTNARLLYFRGCIVCSLCLLGEEQKQRTYRAEHTSAQLTDSRQQLADTHVKATFVLYFFSHIMALLHNINRFLIFRHVMDGLSAYKLRHFFLAHFKKTKVRH